jgi:hypothetical protein
MKRACLRVAFIVLAWLIATATPISAAPVGLTTPLTGDSTGAKFVVLTAGFDLNGSAGNLVGQELYVAFSGLTPVPGSYGLGSVFLPFEADLIETHGLCADLFCGVPEDDPTSPATYLSLVSVFAPFRPSGPGTLFSLRFAVDPSASTWSLNLLGLEGSALLSDECDPADPGCVLDPFAMPFAIVAAGAAVPAGIARVEASVNVIARPVPEPATLVLCASGLLVFLARRRAARTR